MTLLRWVALPAGYVNAAAMFLAMLAQQPLVFYGSWLGATLAFYGWVLVREDEACLLRAGR